MSLCAISVSLGVILLTLHRVPQVKITIRGYLKTPRICHFDRIEKSCPSQGKISRRYLPALLFSEGRPALLEMTVRTVFLNGFWFLSATITCFSASSVCYPLTVSSLQCAFCTSQSAFRNLQSAINSFFPTSIRTPALRVPSFSEGRTLQAKAGSRR